MKRLPLAVRHAPELAALAAEPDDADAPYTRPDRGPIVVSFGAGLDSHGVLVGFKRRGIIPDLVMFADTGSEHPETYAAIPAVSRWLQSWAGIGITVVRVRTSRAQYSTLEGNAAQNDTLPALAFGRHSCSIRWKQEPLDAYVLAWEPAKRAIADGRKVIRVIGYDAGGADSKRFAKVAGKVEAGKTDDRWEFRFPLQAWGWARKRIAAEVAAETDLADALEAATGSRVPRKSACFYCPAAKKPEIRALALEHPDLALRAAAMEWRAANGKHGLKGTIGLGRRFAWHAYLVGEGLMPADWLERCRAKGYLPSADAWAEYETRHKAATAAVSAAQAEHDAEPTDATKEALRAAKRAKRNLRGPGWEKGYREPDHPAWGLIAHLYRAPGETPVGAA